MPAPQSASAPPKTLPDFIGALEQSCAAGRFIKLSLAAYKGVEDGLKAIHIKPVILRGAPMLSFTYRYKTRDITKNYATSEGIALIGDALGQDFNAATLRTSAFDLQFERLVDGKIRIKRSEATRKDAPDMAHDRQKNRMIETQGKEYLHALEITDAQGRVLKSAQDKFRQIDKYIEILGHLIDDLPGDLALDIADMGSGKGYLTFALYDYITNKRGRPARVTGIEYRQDMVDLCNKIAAQSGFTGLRFVRGAIGDYEMGNTNVLIALHACDTATDDAIHKALMADAALIVVAPCCHKQVRREMEAHKAHNDLDFLTRHGIFMERQAEMATDGLRALIIQYFGYQTKIFEFISNAHTAKNIMIVATKKSGRRDVRDPDSLERIKQAKAFFGIGRHHLEDLCDL